MFSLTNTFSQLSLCLGCFGGGRTYKPKLTSFVLKQRIRHAISLVQCREAESGNLMLFVQATELDEPIHVHLKEAQSSHTHALI